MDCSDKTQKVSQSLINEMRLPTEFSQIVELIYLPLVTQILHKKSDAPLFISVNGAQGTGKSTLTHFLKHLIEAQTAFSVAEFSLDDFYSTRAEREKLAETIHPLLQTRGVPGTHDLNLIENTLTKLLEGHSCTIPRFNKAMDERYGEEHWTSCDKKTDIILFEGWCNHSPVQNDEELSTAINKLESNEDPEGIWRHYANEQLKIYHQRIFNHADMSIILKAPDFEKIFEWRSLQEEKLRQKTKSDEKLDKPLDKRLDEQLDKPSRIMSAAALERFIQHYERITRHTLQHLPTTADIVIPIADDHSINKIIHKHVA